MKNATRTKTSKMVRTLLLGVFVSSFALSSLSPAFAEGEDRRMQLAPGARQSEEERRIAIEQQKLPFPDLGFCSQLKDEKLYRGGDKVMRVIYVGKGGWLYRSLDFRTDYTMSQDTLDSMQRLKDRLKEKGTELYIVLQPSRAVVANKHIDPKEMPEGYDWQVAKKNYQGLISTLQGLGINITDLSSPPDDFEYFFKGDPHWRREGANWSAQQVAKLVLQHPLFKTKEKEEFSNEITWWLESEKGEFDEFVEKVCKVIVPPERRPMWATTALTQVTSADALFGDVTYPDIAIVGTSNTAHEEDFNFVGSLKLALKSDIRNRAMSAGGFGGAGVVFFSTDEFQDYPPKILLWEFLSHHTFEDPVAFRQMIPAVSGKCSGENLLASAEKAFAPPPPESTKEDSVQPASADQAAATAPQAGEGTPAQEAVTPQKPPVAEPSTLAVYGPELPNAKKRKKKYEAMNEVMFFDNLDTQNVMAQGSYLELEVTQPESRQIKIGVLYDNGEAEEVDVSRSIRAENNGRYFLEFDQKYAGKVVMVQIATDKPKGQIKAQICKYKDGNI
ncbi:MAG: hypothetical protein KDI90_06275 [Alphaproteobacteria bacterium]|nr:hypothetical protein [Alphaproteobacteria bacterium]MCB9975819.1 hypothetical protein [Rhodospirillales bacterium]